MKPWNVSIVSSEMNKKIFFYFGYVSWIKINIKLKILGMD